jgi:hypothetical protein
LGKAEEEVNMSYESGVFQEEVEVVVGGGSIEVMKIVERDQETGKVISAKDAEGIIWPNPKISPNK